ncbi:OR1L8 protein, partial [Crocuta crocuta]
MERDNQTNSVSSFILLGLSSRPEDQKPLFILFLTMYLVTITGNLLIILAIHSDPQLQTPMYFFLSFLSSTDICFTTTIVPRMLVSFLSEKTISYAGCLTQMYFVYALGNTDSCLLAVMAFDRYVAICDPFHYVTTMNHRRCVLLVAFSCSLPHLHSLLHTLLLNRLTFCDSNVIHHFLCDINPMMKLPEDQKPLFILFLTMYLVTITGNLLIILAIHSDPQLQTPMYFFLSFLSSTDICFTTTIVPRMLVSFLSEKTISYAGCLTQMYFVYALGNTDSCLLAVMAFDRYVAICDPFHYVTTMNHRRCVLLVAFSCSLPHLHSLLHTLLLNRLTFCDSNVIHHFLCDINPMMKLSCSSIFVNEIVIMSEGSVVLVTPFLCVTFSYIRVLITVLRIPSAAGKRKAFSTCGSHLT